MRSSTTTGMNSAYFRLIAIQAKPDEDTLTEVSSDVSSSFEKERDLEISRDVVARSDLPCSPTSSEVGGTAVDVKELSSQPQKENQQASCQPGKASVFSGGEEMSQRDTADGKAAGTSMSVNRATADSDVVLTRNVGQSCCRQTTPVELLDRTATSETSVSSRRYDWSKACHIVDRKSAVGFWCSSKEGDVGRSRPSGLQEGGAASAKLQISPLKESAQQSSVKASTSVCGHEFCCHRLSHEGTRTDPRTAILKTESKQCPRMRNVHDFRSSAAAEHPVSDDGEVRKLGLLNGKGTDLRQTLCDRGASSVFGKVSRGVPVMGLELSPMISAHVSDRSRRDALISFSSSCSQEEKDFPALSDRDPSQPLVQPCQKLYRNFSFSAEAGAARDRRQVLRRASSVSDTSSTSSCFATGVPAAAGETVTSRLRFQRNHQDHGQGLHEYLTPSQRKDLLIRELKQQARHLAKVLQDRDEEAESWRTQIRAERMELMAAAQQETEEAKNMAALAEQEVTSLRSSYEESVKMVSSLQTLVDELKQKMAKQEQEQEEKLLEMFSKGRASAVFEREEELEMQAKNSGKDAEVKSTITDLHNKLVRTQAELARWQTLQRHEAYYTARTPGTEAEATLTFLKDCVYHYLTADSPKDADGHLRAVVRILQFSEPQKEKIAKTLIRKRNKSLTGLH